MSNTAELMTINIVIADRSYRLKINKGQEELIRKTCKIVNDKIIEFKGTLAGRDMQDYVAMALVWFASDQRQQGRDDIFLAEMLESVKQMEATIDKLME